MKKTIKRASLGILLICSISFMLMWFILPNLILRPYRLDIRQQPELIHYKTSPQDFGLTGEDISFTTKDSTHISALLINSQIQPAKATIIMLHGIGACKETFLPMAADYGANSINVVLIDHRAHGQSGGEYCTYGYREKRDINELVTRLKERDSKTPIGLHGVSLGGAIAWQTLAIDHRIDFAIIESTFDDWRNVIREYLARYIGFRFDALADFAMWRAAAEADINVYEVIPSKAAEKVTCPIFCAHGSRDIHIPIQYGINNFKHLKGSENEFHIIHGADHNNVQQIGGVNYRKMKLAFIHEQGLKKE